MRPNLIWREIVYFAVGLLFLFLSARVLQNLQSDVVVLRSLLVVALLSASLMQAASLFNAKLSRRRAAYKGFTPLLNAGLALFFAYAPDRLFGLAPYLFGGWAMLNALLSLVNLFLQRRDGDGAWYWQLVAAFLYALLGLSFFIGPLHRFVAVNLLIALYFAAYGLCSISDGLQLLFPSKRQVHARHLRVVLPSFISSFIPQRLLTTLNLLIAAHSLPQVLDERDESRENLELFIHLSRDSASAFGHCDVCVEDKVYSYGCYDWLSKRVFGAFSEGVMAVTERSAYIHHCLHVEKKVLVGFGLRVSSERMAAVQSRLAKMRSVMVPWKPPRQQLEEAGASEQELSAAVDDASLLYGSTHAHFYKFRKGRLKTYFFLGNNCVKVADYIIGAAGIDAVGSGIVTPGTYYSFLSDLYRRGDLVRSRNVYALEENAKLEHA